MCVCFVHKIKELDTLLCLFVSTFASHKIVAGNSKQLRYECMKDNLTIKNILVQQQYKKQNKNRKKQKKKTR